nr:hypothetical protein [Chthoniobacter flavus]
MNAPHIRLNQHSLSVHRLPNVRKTRIDFDPGDELEIGMLADRCGQRAAAGKDLQCSPWWPTGALSPNRKRSY